MERALEIDPGFIKTYHMLIEILELEIKETDILLNKTSSEILKNGLNKNKSEIQKRIEELKERVQEQTSSCLTESINSFSAIAARSCL